jgi:hypothetical protein
VNRAVKTSALLLLGFIVAGCVSLTTQQQQRVDEIQRLADRTTAFYGLPLSESRFSARPISTSAVSTGRAISC